MNRRQLVKQLGAGGAALSIFSLSVSPSSAQRRPSMGDPLRRAIEKLPSVEGLPTLGAGELDDRPVLVNFFASWCPPCRIEFDHLNKVSDGLKSDRLRIVALNVHEQWDENDAVRMQRFIATTKPRFTVLKANESIREMFGGINRIPTVYGFDRKGLQRYEFIHKRGAKKTNASYQDLITASRILLAADG